MRIYEENPARTSTMHSSRLLYKTMSYLRLVSLLNNNVCAFPIIKPILYSELYVYLYIQLEVRLKFKARHTKQTYRPVTLWQNARTLNVRVYTEMFVASNGRSIFIDVNIDIFVLMIRICYRMHIVCINHT